MVPAAATARGKASGVTDLSYSLFLQLFLLVPVRASAYVTVGLCCGLDERGALFQLLDLYRLKAGGFHFVCSCWVSS